MTPSAASRTHVALLRGINVGGRNKVLMKDLAALFEAAGCRDVTTYIQSGNVVFTAGSTLVRGLPRRITAALAEKAGVRSPVVLRSAAELRQVVARNPFRGAKGVEPAHLHVGFLAGAPQPDRVAALAPDRSPGDRFQVLGSEVYLCCPNGVARTKLTVDWFDRGLGTVVTVRNWRTVQKLVELCA